MSSGRGVIQTFQRLRDALRSKELVGVDKNGNKFYRWFEHSGSQRRERREVKASGPSYMYDPHSITGEWRMWLHKTRQDPPTEEEIAKSQAKAEALRQKVALLEEREKMRRYQAQSMGGATGGSDANINTFLQGMAQQGFNSGQQEKQGSKST